MTEEWKQAALKAVDDNGWSDPYVSEEFIADLFKAGYQAAIEATRLEMNRLRSKEGWRDYSDDWEDLVRWLDGKK